MEPLQSKLEKLKKFKKHDNSPPAVGICFMPYEEPFEIKREEAKIEEKSLKKANIFELVKSKIFKDKTIYTMRLVIRASYREDLQILVNPLGTIQDVKEVIHEKEGIKTFNQTLAYNGKILNEDRTLREYEIPPGSILYLIVRVSHSCFLPEAPVFLSDGSTKMIKDIKVGDSVLTYDVKNRLLKPHRVVSIDLYKSNYLCEIELEYKKIICTPNHPFWVVGKGWKAVEPHPNKKSKPLQIGDSLLGSDLNMVKVKSIRILEFKNVVDVYNMHIESAHNYFAYGVLVHNTQIFIRNMAGNTYSLNINLSESISAIKVEVFKKLKILPKDQCLIFAGRILNDQRTLADYNIKKENTLHLYPYCSDSSFSFANEENKLIELNIIYKTATYLLPSLSTVKIRGLKEQIKSLVGSYEDIELLFGGHILTNEDNKLIDYKLDSNSDILVIPGPNGGYCLRFLETMSSTHINDLTSLRSSLNFVRDQQSLNECWDLALEIIKTDMKTPQFDLPKTPELMAIMLWASGAIYQEVNETLMRNGDLSQWKIYLKHLVKGLAFMPYYMGKCFLSQKDDDTKYKKGEIVEWKIVSVFTKKKETALKGKSSEKIFFEVDVVSARDFSAVSLQPDEEEIMIMPYSYFEVVEVNKVSNQPVVVKLREIPVPRGSKVLFWVDDHPENNQYYAQDLEKMNISCVFCTSTRDALRVINNFRWLLYFENADFRIITDMVRDENGVLNFTAGVDLLKSLFKDYKYSFEVLVFCSDVQKAKLTLDKEKLGRPYRITSSEVEMINFINFSK